MQADDRRAFSAQHRSQCCADFYLIVFCTLLYLCAELLRLLVVQLAVHSTDVRLQLAELLAQRAQGQCRVQALVVQILEGLQPRCHILNLSQDLRKTLAGDPHLQGQRIRSLQNSILHFIYTHVV